MLTILQELNIDCFQGYGNSYCKDYIIRLTLIRLPRCQEKNTEAYGVRLKYRIQGLFLLDGGRKNLNN
jgi:hypothetical protein